MTGEELTDRVVVVTGAARGIGRALVMGFLAAGARVVALDHSWDGCDEERADLDRGPRSMTGEVDITDRSALSAVRGAVLDRFATVDVLVNNAALRQRALFPPTGVVDILDTTDEHWSRMIEVNLFGTLRATRVFIEPMLGRGGGSIVNVGSRGSVLRPVEEGIWSGGHPTYRNQPYDASKAALSSLTMYLAEEVRDRNVAVNLLFPGATNTTGSAEILAGRRASGITTPDLLRPEHVVPLALHLAVTRPGSGMTGHAVDSLRWNARNGHGTPSDWRA